MIRESDFSCPVVLLSVSFEIIQISNKYILFYRHICFASVLLNVTSFRSKTDS